MNKFKIQNSRKLRQNDLKHANVENFELLSSEVNFHEVIRYLHKRYGMSQYSAIKAAHHLGVL